MILGIAAALLGFLIDVSSEFLSEVRGYISSSDNPF